MRSDPKLGNAAHLVSVSPVYLRFRYGKRAFSGRFFAANELEVALVHLMMKYDWHVLAGSKKIGNLVQDAGFGLILDPTAKILVKKRHPEIDVDSI